MKIVWGLGLEQLPNQDTNRDTYNSGVRIPTLPPSLFTLKLFLTKGQVALTARVTSLTC